MQLQILDFILIGIMAVSGLLALARGFTREVLSLIAWGLAAVAAFFALKQQPLLDAVTPYVDKPILAQIAVGAIAFILTLIIVSVISVKLSDKVVDSSVGAFDRTLGFIYGLARGLVLVAIAYIFYSWLQPRENHEDWIRNAVSLPTIQTFSDFMVSMMPPDIARTLTDAALPTSVDGQITAPEGQQQGLTEGQQQGLDNLVEGQQPAQQTPAPAPAPAEGTQQ
jgi:membrane protein required for colicin V production